MGYGRVEDDIKTSSRSFVKAGLFSDILPYMEQQAAYNLQERAYYNAGKPYYNDPARDHLVETYVCPSWPYDRVNLTAPANYEYRLGALVTYAGVAGAIQNRGEKLVTSVEGQIPDNGAFVMGEVLINGRFPEAVGRARQIGEIVDGQSNSLLIAEYVHVNCEFQQIVPEDIPGNVRPWYVGGYSNVPYAMKVVENAPNICVHRQLTPVPLNHLPLGSYHPGLIQTVRIDGSVQSVTDDIEFEALKALATCNGEEVGNSSGS